ncbi:hypothetical protein KJ865_01980 [Myxococcota bacterium]|nr:hypothetical protein [Myxococcota bacterium]
MIIVCSYCKKKIGEKVAPNLPPGAISHGICEECALNVMAQEGMSFEEYIEGLPQAVIALSGTGVVIHANKKAQALLGKDIPSVRGFAGGDVFECRYALLPGGCGHTIHCVGCTIRNTVALTARTGQSQHRVPAYLGTYKQGVSRDAHLLFSTQFKNNMVLLTIEDMELE